MQLDTLTDTSYMFNNCVLFEYVDLSAFDFSEVVDMEYMFNNCLSIKEIRFPENINTSKVTDMTHLFCNCSKLGIIDFKDFDTDNVKDMSYMFYNCESLENANFSNFNTCKVKDMSYMFTGCINLKQADFSSLIFCRKKDYIFAGLRDEIYECLTAQFNPENIYFNNLFEGCTASHLDLSNFNWHMARDMQKMFKDCVNLERLDMGDVESP
jgi:surface protein